MLFKICPLTMRTKSILLVKDVVVILAQYERDGKYCFYHLRSHQPVNCVPCLLETRVDIWRQSCDQLVALLNEYSRDLLSNLRRFEELGDKGGADMIRSCCVNCFAHLAALCEVLSNIEPAPQTEMDALCDSSLEGLGELAQNMHMEEYTRHDVLLGVGGIQ